MLRQWRVTQFKSLRDPVELDLAPLTVIAGANSSGKSTLIQGMLLLSQTCLSKIQTRPLVLNGPLVRLGSFDDVCSFDSNRREIAFGFELDFPQDGPMHEAFYRFTNTPLTAVQGDVVFGPPKSPRGETAASVEQVQPRLLRSYVRACAGLHTEEEEPAVRVSRYYRSREYRMQREKLGPNSLPLADSLDFVPRFENVAPDDRPTSPGRATLVGCIFGHFLPRALTIKVDIERRDAEMALDLIATASATLPTSTRARRYWSGREDQAPPLSREARKIIVQRLLDLWPDEDELTQFGNLLELRTALDRLPPSERRKASAALRSVRPQLERAMLANLTPRYALNISPLPGVLREATDQVDQFFANRVRYLGPLRDEPRPLYPLSASVDVQDVGIKGEYTAAVIDTNRDVLVSFLEPTDLEQGKTTAPIVRAPLILGLKRWLEYMGIVDELETADLGNLGHKIVVSTPGLEKLVELPHVGVGVSQVLPIVVSCLLAPAGSTLIFEQPELHLHPRVQTRLADLFLSAALTGRQCIIESHSDYLINRLRVRIAMSESNQLDDVIRMYFVDKVGMQSQFRHVVINEYGAIGDWPQGFFDQGQADAELLIEAAMRKRARRTRADA